MRAPVASPVRVEPQRFVRGTARQPFSGDGIEPCADAGYSGLFAPGAESSPIQADTRGALALALLVAGAGELTRRPAATEPRLRPVRRHGGGRPRRGRPRAVLAPVPRRARDPPSHADAPRGRPGVRPRNGAVAARRFRWHGAGEPSVQPSARFPPGLCRASTRLPARPGPRVYIASSDPPVRSSTKLPPAYEVATSLRCPQSARRSA